MKPVDRKCIYLKPKLQKMFAEEFPQCDPYTHLLQCLHSCLTAYGRCMHHSINLLCWVARVPLHFVDVNSVPGSLVSGNGIRVRAP